MFIWWIPWCMMLIFPNRTESLKNYTSIPTSDLPFIIYHDSHLETAKLRIKRAYGTDNQKSLEGMGGSAVQTLTATHFQKFAAEPTPQMAVLGSTAVLPCRVTGKVGQLQWTKDGFGLGTDRTLFGYSRYFMIGSDDEGDFSLKISPILLADDALYQCQVSAGRTVPGIRSEPVRLTVYSPPDPPVLKPTVIKTTAGMAINITCESSGGRPAPEIQWIDDSEREPIRIRISETKNKMGDNKRFIVHSRLLFTPQRKHNNQTITCSTSNQALSSPLTISALLHVYFPPDVVLKSVPEQFVEGEDIMFTCDAQANPAFMKYRWFRNGVELHNKTSRILRLTNVLRDFHHGTVSCEVSNEVGASKKTQRVYIRYGPRFRTAPKDVMSELGDEVDLKCDVESNPEPNIMWLRGHSNKVIGSGPIFRLKASTETAGLYRCIARVRGIDYEFSDLEGKVRVLIKGPPKILSRNEQQGKTGSTVEIECKSVSVPRPMKVTWSYQGRNIEGGDPHYKIVNDEDKESIRNVLVIQNAKPSDFGDYNCSVVNEYGVARQQIRLKEKQKVSVYLITGCITTLVVAIGLFAVYIVIRFRKQKPNRREATNGDMKETPKTSNGGLPVANMYSAASETKLDDDISQRPFIDNKLSPASPRLDSRENARIQSDLAYVTPIIEPRVNRRASMTDISVYPPPPTNNPMNHESQLYPPSSQNPPEFCTIRRPSRTGLSSPVLSTYRNGGPNPTPTHPLATGRIEYAYRPPSNTPPPPPYPKGYAGSPKGFTSPKSYSRPYEDPETQYIFSPEAMLKPGTLV